MIKRFVGAVVGMAMGALIGLGVALAGAGSQAIFWCGILGGVIFFIGPGRGVK
ncbi:MAG TPA: hypothetical protein VG672_25405 [Bryobacteraceae bacterium]|jgi:hypothetical protein|nr:hypothetical protein [Bryobacteraceae bacterium]